MYGNKPVVASLILDLFEVYMERLIHVALKSQFRIQKFVIWSSGSHRLPGVEWTISGVDK